MLNFVQMDTVSLNNLVFSNAENGSVELDASTLAGLKKMPVDIFDNVYVGDVKPHALILCVDVRGFSTCLCSHAAYFKLFILCKSIRIRLLILQASRRRRFGHLG